MKPVAVLSRRRALQFFAGAPMLPLSSTFAGSFLLAGCGGGDDVIAAPGVTPAARYSGVSFSSMPAPTLANPAAMATTSVGSTMTVNYSDSSTVDFKLAYQPFFVTGDMVADVNGGKTLSGGYYDINNQPIIDNTVAGKARQFFSDAPDGTSLLSVPGAKVDGVKGNTVFAVVQFEYTTWAQDGKTDMYGKLPSPIAVLTLDQDPQTGKLSLVKYHNVDTSKVHGLWITCGASLSPWGTHLSSEEYEPDAFALRSKNVMDDFSQNLYGDPAKANPYHYGHLPEVTVNPDGTAAIKKHFCLGRISHELVQVMPDNRTVFMGDDATNSGYFVFVADNEKDLSSGTLYVAKVGAGFSIVPGDAAAALTWIKLGSASSAEIENLATTLKPADIMGDGVKQSRLYALQRVDIVEQSHANAREFLAHDIHQIDLNGAHAGGTAHHANVKTGDVLVIAAEHVQAQAHHGRFSGKELRLRAEETELERRHGGRGPGRARQQGGNAECNQNFFHGQPPKTERVFCLRISFSSAQIRRPLLRSRKFMVNL